MAKGKEKSFLGNFMILGMGSFIYLLVGLIGTPIITRLVDPVEYGKMSIFTVYSSIGMMLCGMGLDQTLVRYFYRDEDINYKRKLLTECYFGPTILAAVLSVALMVSSLTASKFGIEFLPISEAVLLSINIIALLIHRYAILLLRLRYHTKLYSTVNVIQKASYILLTILMVYILHDHYFMILIVATIMSTVISLLIAVLYEKDIWKPAAKGYHLPFGKAELYQYGLPLMLSSGISMIFNALDKLFIKHYCTPTDLGVYASAINLMAVFSIVRTSFNALWMPSAIEHYENHPEDKKFYQRGNAFVSILMITMGAGVILCKDFFVLLLGSKYREASLILPFLMFEPIMYTISETTATGIVVQKKTAYQIMVVGGAFIVNFIGNLWLTPLMGPRGAAISTGVSYVVFFMIRTVLANKVFYVDYKLFRFLIVSVVLLLFAIYGSTHAFSWVQILMFIGVVAAAIFAYREYLNDAFVYGKKVLNTMLKK